MNCPACGRSVSKFPYTRCDTCGACYCGNGNCTGTVGIKGAGSGRAPGTTCPACRKGKLKKI
jgi:hypothetical protein